MMSEINREYPRRKIIRKKGYDYSIPAMYFITICAFQKQNLFGLIENNKVILSNIGIIIDECLKDLISRFGYLQLDYYTIMPNHIHTIIFLHEKSPVGAGLRPARLTSSPPESARLTSSPPEPARLTSSPPEPARFSPESPRNLSISDIIGLFKSFTSRKIRESKISIHSSIWQRGFYDRIIRNEKELHAIREYIMNNPIDWNSDPENPFKIE
jgi:REP element-mobilizing transposase RayT